VRVCVYCVRECVLTVHAHNYTVHALRGAGDLEAKLRRAGEARVALVDALRKSKHDLLVQVSE